MPTADSKKWFRKRQLSEGEAACLLVGFDPDEVRLPLPKSIMEAAEELRRAFNAGELCGWKAETDDDFHRLFGDGEDGDELWATGQARYYSTPDLIDWAGPERYPLFPFHRVRKRPTSTESTTVPSGPNQMSLVVPEGQGKKQRRPPAIEVKRRREIVTKHMKKPADFKNAAKVNALFSELDNASIPLPSRGGSSPRTGTYMDLKRDLQKRVIGTLTKDLQR